MIISKKACKFKKTNIISPNLFCPHFQSETFFKKNTPSVSASIIKTVSGASPVWKRPAISHHIFQPVTG